MEVEGVEVEEVMQAAAGCGGGAHRRAALPRGEHRREQRVVAADAERFGLANETRVNWRVN